MCRVLAPGASPPAVAMGHNQSTQLLCHSTAVKRRSACRDVAWGCGGCQGALGVWGQSVVLKADHLHPVTPHPRACCQLIRLLMSSKVAWCGQAWQGHCTEACPGTPPVQVCPSASDATRHTPMRHLTLSLCTHGCTCWPTRVCADGGLPGGRAAPGRQRHPPRRVHHGADLQRPRRGHAAAVQGPPAGHDRGGHQRGAALLEGKVGGRCLCPVGS